MRGRPLHLSALTRAAGRPPLAYSLPGFHPHAYRASTPWLEALAAHEFRWVTFHPTYPVFDGDPAGIGAGPDVGEALRTARALGLCVRLEPHLDYASSLAGGPYRWRCDMRIDPLGQYFEQVLAPLADLGAEELTLGSELDVSASEFSERWAEAAEAMRSRTTSRLGHKLNHDWRESLPVRRMQGYLRALDYKAVSWYVPHRRPVPEGWTIGEFGLGSTDIRRPWHFDAATFRTPADFAVRRRWYLQTVEWLPESGSAGAACFWTAGQFDILGVFHPYWGDEEVVEAVRAYNQASP